MEQSSFISNIKFYDDDNFPYGFSRSGEFSTKESELLTHCGYLMHQLVNKKISAENEEHKHFISVVSGKTKPLYQVEELYLKYQSIINKRNNLVSTCRAKDKE